MHLVLTGPSTLSQEEQRTSKILDELVQFVHDFDGYVYGSYVETWMIANTAPKGLNAFVPSPVFMWFLRAVLRMYHGKVHSQKKCAWGTSVFVNFPGFSGLFTTVQNPIASLDFDTELLIYSAEGLCVSNDEITDLTLRTVCSKIHSRSFEILPKNRTPHQITALMLRVCDKLQAGWTTTEHLPFTRCQQTHDDACCSICQDPFKVGEDWEQKMPCCGHYFHARCLWTWWDQKRSKQTCPLCNAIHAV